MPPKKRRRQRAQKAQLLFHEQPLECPKRHYGAPQQPITHTLQVPSKPIDHSTITSWVTPQFDTTAESWFPARRKHPRNQGRRSSRKSTSRFPHLTFESPQLPSGSETLDIPLITEGPKQSGKDICGGPLVPALSPQSCGELSAHTLQSLPYLLIPPDIQTPGSPSMKDNPVSPDPRESSLPSCLLRTDAPSSPEPGPVLVRDTPEEKYGIKVTWQRRRHLFAHLRERGKLSRSQFLVQS